MYAVQHGYMTVHGATIRALRGGPAAANAQPLSWLAYRPRFYNPDLGKWLHRIHVPSLLVWGAQDGLVPPQFGEAYRALIPSSPLVVLPEAGHAPFDEQKDAFLAVFCDFIDP